MQAMVKKQKQQQLATGGGLISSLFSNISKQQDNITTGAVLPCHPSSSASMPSSSTNSAWRWASCGLHPRTLSFRQQQQPPPDQENASVDFSTDSAVNSSSSYSYTASSEDEVEAVIQALRSDRLLYEPDGNENEILKQSRPNKNKPLVLNKCAAAGGGGVGDNEAPLMAFGGATAMSLESQHPYRDFRESMEAMVMSQVGQEGGVKDWRWLEDMLGWYLRANAKTTHGLIVGAFVDLLLELTTNAAPDAAEYYSSSSSSPADTPAANCSVSSTDGDHCSC